MRTNLYYMKINRKRFQQVSITQSKRVMGACIYSTECWGLVNIDKTLDNSNIYLNFEY